MKRTIRLRESELRRMISESVRRVLREGKYLPDGYDDEWEKNVDDDSNETVDFEHPSMFGFPTLRNPYKDAKNRLERTNDTESNGYPNGTIFGFEQNPEEPYGREDWSYDRNGNKNWKGYRAIYDDDDMMWDMDEWDYDNNQPIQKTLRNQSYEVPSSPFASDVRDLNKKSYMSPNGKYEKDLKQMNKNSDMSYRRALKSADKRPLHTKKSPNRDIPK